MDSSEAGHIADAQPVYHERQSKELCAMHVLNNLFQKKHTFTKKDLDDICLRLCPDSKLFNPHRSMWGLGNYDINVLMTALKKKGYEIKWWDKRRDVDILAMEHVMGLILNVPSEFKIGFVKLPFDRRHWITIKHLQGRFMNLDSKLDGPKLVGNGDFDSLVSFLREEMKDKEKQLFLVVTQEVNENALWMRSNADAVNGGSVSKLPDEDPSNKTVLEEPNAEENGNIKDSSSTTDDDNKVAVNSPANLPKS